MSTTFEKFLDGNDMAEKTQRGNLSGQSLTIIPEVWQKQHPTFPLMLQMSIEGIHKENGPWYEIFYWVVHKSGKEVATLGFADWADWAKQGNLLFGQAGCLYRQEFLKAGPKVAAKIADFNENKFEAIEPPKEAQRL